MYLVDAIFTLFKLRWTQEEPKFRPLPPFIERRFVKTSDGLLELLVCKPATSSAIEDVSSTPAIFFAHGGYGSAGVWLEWMTYLHQHGYQGTLYSFSVRNHGASYALPYSRMVFRTSFEHIQSDMVSCLDEAIRLEREQNSTARLPIVVGHSSGGGLAQKLLSASSVYPALRIQASGLCLVGAIPSYGSYDIYWNWFKHDPWFTLRSMFHFQHPTSPLSTNGLVHGAFFGHKFPLSQTPSFQKWMPAFESMGWPVGMLGGGFWKWCRGEPNQWLNVKDIARNIVVTNAHNDKVLVMIGREDMMYRPFMWERQCQEYRDAFHELAMDVNSETYRLPEISHDTSIDKVNVASSGRVRLALVEDSGHHVQNDVYHEQAAEALLRWAKQV